MRTTREVDAFMADLDHPLKAEIEALRKIILGADSRITESIKWNAPSFALNDHFATFKLRPPTSVQIVLHRGAKKPLTAKAMEITDPAGLLKWATPDRCVATLTSMPQIQANEAGLITILQEWIAQL